jgi:FtsZ-binding cell division protein ZapB
MELILGGSALFVALAAMWTATHAIKKSDGETADLIRNHIAKMKVELAQSSQALEKSQRKIDALETAVKKLKEMRDEDMEHLFSVLGRRSGKSPAAQQSNQAAQSGQPRLD